LVDLGLIVERERGQVRDGERHYDRFRDRIMFPIRDSRGRVIAFGGRILDQGEPKYLNSPETVLFHKGRELYALYEARRSTSNLKRLLIVEGYMDAVRLHQYGINYAVATLGTATTPEHLKRIFRIVSEVVFAFDGDRAGRGAAWRALQHALPEARQGREIRFLFLPEGQDPDSLVGLEGKEAFERRLESTLPLSEYLIKELSEQSDLAHADGRARFSENARPLWAKLPEGVYRELMLGRIAEVVGIAPQRLHELWQGEKPLSTATPAPAVAAKRVPARHASGGRGSLVRQAVLQLVSYPAIALEVSDPERAALEACEEAGIELLRELIDNLRLQPARSPAQVIERWNGRPGGDSLEKLLQREQIVADAMAAAGELHAALGKLAHRVVEKRLQELEKKSRSTRLEPDELLEFQKLMSNLGTREARGG
jgi:DNA primase